MRQASITEASTDDVKLFQDTVEQRSLDAIFDEDSLPDELDVIKPIIKTEMENAYTLAVPLDVELGMGSNWLEAH